MRRIFLLFILVLIYSQNFAQSEDIKVGFTPRQLPANAGYFDYSDPNTLNISVSIWGGVKFPGKYVIPIYSRLSDFISYAGGPTVDGLTDDIRIYRILPDSSQSMMKFNFDPLIWEKNLLQDINNPEIQPGDIVVIPSEPRFFFRDYFSITLSIISTLISLTILVLNLVRN